LRYDFFTEACMSTPDSPQQFKPFDSEPLSWVMVEIREALGRSKTALFEAGAANARNAPRHCSMHARTCTRRMARW